jgi:putative FmdB family regulatory protein
MPIYQYLCAECSNRFQEYRQVAERSVSRCPKCGGRAKKLFGAVGIIFKGSGFYTTDYRKPEDKKPAEAETSTPPKAAAADPK